MVARQEGPLCQGSGTGSPTRGASHLRVSALAGVHTYGVWQGAYLTEGLQKRSTKVVGVSA
jgi:hypothetical protein